MKKLGFGDDYVFSLSRNARVALLVISGELEGNEFDWTFGRWKEKK